MHHHLPGGADTAPVLWVAVSDALTYATINGTILAILIAAVTGYFLVIFQSLDRMRTALIEHANAINRVKLGFWTSGPEAFPPTGLTFEQLNDLLSRLAYRGPPGPDWPQLPAPSQTAERGAVLMRVISELVRTYPLGEPPRGEDDMGEERVSLTTDRQVRDWLPDAETALANLDLTLQERAEVLSGLAAAHWRETGGRTEEALAVARQDIADAGLDPDELLPHFTPPVENMVDRFRAYVAASRDVVSRAQVEADQLARYEDRLLPPRRLALAGALVFIAAFIGGVALPMVCQNASTVFYAWLPAAIYVACLGLALVQIWRHYHPGSVEVN